MKYTVKEFAEEIRKLYPNDYNDLSDEKLVELWLKKYPNDTCKVDVSGIDQSVKHSVSNNQSQISIPPKKNGYLKYLLILVFAVIAFLYFKVSGRNSYDSEGYKQGKWTEYINGNGTKELPKDSASFIRELVYNHGVPVGLCKDYYPNGKLQCEFYLISQPYSKDNERPKDKYKGIIKWFDENAKIKSWMYYDDQGNEDMEKYILLSTEDIKLDSRFDEAIFKEKYAAERELLIQLHKSTQETEKLTRQIENYLSNTNDELPPMSQENEFENTASDNNQSSGNSTQRLNQRCNHCYGTGKCPSCKGPFTVHYWDSRSNSWKNRNEVRPGYRMCSGCNGAGVIYGTWNYNVNPKQPTTKPCYVGGCMDGWLFCNECNPSGNGNNLGVCKECNGTGISKYQY